MSLRFTDALARRLARLRFGAPVTHVYQPLVYARGRYERVGENRNVLVNELASLSPLAREVSQVAEVGATLPGAHHLGHR